MEPDPVDSGVPDAGAPMCGADVTLTSELALTERGVVRGVAGDGAISFRGIPYVKPPVGDLRWRAPETDSTCWSGIRDATQWAPMCPQLQQQQGSAFDAGAPIEGQEDCLTLNVFKPAASDGGLPVMVFIHGGGNTGGSAVEEIGTTGVKLYDGALLASRGNVVVVTLQYRVGVLGYLTLDDEIVGNYGLLDQQAALKWVQRNVAHFGGDASNVTLFGESAGAVNTCTQLAMPGSAGLFHRAIIQSGSCTALTAAEKKTEGATWLASTSCTDAACLRAMTPEQLIRAYPVPVNVGSRRPTVSWNPNVDGVVLPRQPVEAIRDGEGHDVPVIVGHNTEETNLSMPLVTTEAEYRAALATLAGPALVDPIIQRYPVATFGSPRKALVQVTTDIFFGCQARLSARASARSAPTYRYLFSRAPQALRGAFHGVELAYVFQRSGLGGTAADAAVEATMLNEWTSFAKTGAPTWAAYTSTEPMFVIDSPTSSVSGWRNAECDFFESLGGISIPPPP
ncbi:MAG: carboxylesterase/lipase family protein [Archangium sp.]